ncbi:MAG: V-type ATP synthase subunit E [Candidatus Limivivens sp.]|nr:V-type ATP synthase subunit E [Candidatus Limivivens sp.]
MKRLTTEEKLKHFEEAAVERARGKSAAAIAEHQAALDQLEAEHRAEKDRQAALQIKTETESLNRSINIALSKEQLQIKRRISQKNDELKDKLFIEIRSRLEEFMATPAYPKLLEKQIREILEIAGDEPVTIYLDPNDQALLLSLNAVSNTAISLSDYSFMGGTRAVLPGRHMLIDNSFETKLEEAQETFTFSGGAIHE